MALKKREMAGIDWANALDAIRRGRVVRLDLSGAKGGELENEHYAVVVSNDALNKRLRTLIVVPLTSHGAGGTPRPYEVFVKAGEGGLAKDGYALPHQIRTIDRTGRVLEIWDSIEDVDTMTEIEDQLAFVTGITFEDDN